MAIQDTPQQLLSGYGYADEAASMADFDAIVESSGAFHLYREIWGEPLFHRPGTQLKQMRVDRILTPNRKLLDAGWKGGVIIVEGKRADFHLGKAVSQAQDYARCAFTLPSGGVRVVADWVFIWPLEGEPKGDVGSIMAQSRIGWVSSSAMRPLVFGCGGTHGITVNSDGSVFVKQFPMGRKTGNRG